MKLMPHLTRTFRIMSSAAAGLALLTTASLAEMTGEREGWVIFKTTKAHDELTAILKNTVQDNQMGVVTQAGPTQAAANRGVDIPGNRVMGVFNNVYAVRILGLSTAAMIEAPIRFYITENNDGSATLSYKTPSHVFAPYFEEGGEDLIAAAAELDEIFLTIAGNAAQ